MARQRGAVGAGLLLGLLTLTLTGRADEAAAVKAIEQLGGRVTRDQGVAGEPIVGVDLSGTKVADAALKELKGFTRLLGLDLGHTKVTDAGLKKLKEFKGLKELNLSHTQITDKGLKELKGLKRLEWLGVFRTAVTDAGVKELQAALPGLQIIR